MQASLWKSPARAPPHLDLAKSSCCPGRAGPLGLALGSPIFPSGCEGEGKLGVAIESLQGLRDLT